MVQFEGGKRKYPTEHVDIIGAEMEEPRMGKKIRLAKGVKADRNLELLLGVRLMESVSPTILESTVTLRPTNREQ